MDSPAVIDNDDQLCESPCKSKGGASPNSPGSSLTALTNFSGHGPGPSAMNYTVGPGIAMETQYNYDGTIAPSRCFPAFRDNNFDSGLLQTSWTGTEHSLNTATLSVPTMPDEMNIIQSSPGFISTRPSLVDILPEHHQTYPHYLYPKQNHYQSHHPLHSHLMPASKPKRRRVATLAQRKAANIRERKRMTSLNSGFDELRKIVPTFAYEKKISRIETLRLAMVYIAFMTDIVNGVNTENIKLKKIRSNFDHLKKIASGPDRHPTLPATTSGIAVEAEQQLPYSGFLSSNKDFMSS